MKRIHNFILISLSLILLFPYNATAKRGLSVKPISPLGTEVKGNQWLFVIGINTYIHWPRLKTAVNDAKSVKNVLLTHYHFDKKHLIELYDEQATRKNILGKLRYLSQQVKNDDSLVIFYAGHGNLDSITKDGSWVPIESGTNDSSAWITNHDIKKYLEIDVIKAKHILLFSDSCFSGDFFRGNRGKLPTVTDKVIKKAYYRTSRQAITSGGLEPVSDEGFGNNSVFTHFLIKTLKENQKPFLIPSDIFPEIRVGVAENAEQFPQFGSLKGTGGQQGGELVLFLKQKSRLKDLSADASQKNKELERLRQLESESREAKKKEKAEIAKREREVAALDAKIVEMKKSLGTATFDTDDSLDAMLAMIDQKERQQKAIDGLKKKREAEEAKRRAEIARLKEEREQKRFSLLKEDIVKYQKIVSSPYSKGMKVEAWKILTNKYPEAKGLDIGDISGLRAKVVISDGRFIPSKNGTVLDTKTGLMWASKDNGKDINWEDAKRYCRNYRGGGYKDWRMPTIDELSEIYDPKKKNIDGYYITGFIMLSSSCPWSSVTSGVSQGPNVIYSSCFDFDDGETPFAEQSLSGGGRVLPVRNSN